jgi:hypothetical protein
MLNSIKILTVMVVFQFYFLHVAQSQELFKAKLGIEIKAKNEVRRAKAINRIVSGDKLSIYVKPEIDSYVYIVNSNNSGTSLLNRKPENQTVKSEIGRKFPGQGSAYSPDGNDGSETFVIIVSKDKSEKIIKLFSQGTISNDKWLASEQESMRASSLLSPFELQEDMEFGGSLRGADPFFGKLRISAGKAMITQKFEFDVKK